MLNRSWVLVFGLILASCSRPDDVVKSPEQVPPVRKPPRPTCVVRGADSASVVEAALMAAAAADKDWTNARQLRVTAFERQRNGTVVTFLPGALNMVGGGDVIWVPDGGCGVVRERFE